MNKYLEKIAAKGPVKKRFKTGIDIIEGKIDDAYVKERKGKGFHSSAEKKMFEQWASKDVKDHAARRDARLGRAKELLKTKQTKLNKVKGIAGAAAGGALAAYGLYRASKDD